jgi:hypothetical protein
MPLTMGVEFQVERDKFGHMKGIFDARAFLPAKIVLRPMLTDQIEKISAHRGTPQAPAHELFTDGLLNNR